MAEIPFQIAVAFGVQSVLGTADATIAALTGSLTEADGIVLGDPESGVAESGVEISFLREFIEKAAVAGSFTKQASNFVGEALDGFDVSIQLKGNGAGVTAADADFKPKKGVDALIQSCGLLGAAWGSGVGYRYAPGSVQIMTAKVWLNGMHWVIKDIVGSVSFEFEPGNVAIATFSLGGTIDSFSAASTFPTLNYGFQASASAPIIQTVGHNWGISAALRGFTEATLTVDSGTEDIPDSNASAGKRTRQTGREITMEATIFADSGDIDFERSELVRATAPVSLQTFTVGTAATGPLAYRVNLTTPELRSFKPNIAGGSYTAECELVAVNASANGEAELIFL